MKWEMETMSPNSYISNSSWLMEESKSTIWTPRENKLFENALAKFDKDTPDRWQKVAAMVPGKTVVDVMRQYKELEDDVSSIEAGLIPIPGYNTSEPFTLDWGNSLGFDGARPPYGAGGKRSSAARQPEQERKKGVPWTEEEHKLFLLGLKKYGKGDWRNISRNFVITRTPTQVASHAQKYFIRQLSGGKDKRRASIHDITTVNLSDNHISSSPDNKRTPSPESQRKKSFPHQPNSAPMCREAFQWNQAHHGTSMSFNQAQGNMFMSPRYGGNVYGLKVQGQNMQRGGIYESYGVPQSMHFQTQAPMEYHPHA